MVYQFFHGSKKSDLETRIGAQLFVREGKNQQKTLITFFLQQHSVIFYISESLSSILIPFLLLWFIKVDWFFRSELLLCCKYVVMFLFPFLSPLQCNLFAAFTWKSEKRFGGRAVVVIFAFYFLLSYYFCGMKPCEAGEQEAEGEGK